MTRNLTPTALILIAIGLFFFFIDDQVEQLQVNWQDRSRIVQAERHLEQLADLSREIENDMTASVGEHELLRKFVPGFRDDARSMMTVQAIAQDNNIRFSSVGISPSGSVTDHIEAKEINLEVDATYERFIRFIRGLESSLKLHDITSITVNPREGGLHNYRIRLQTYWTE